MTVKKEICKLKVLSSVQGAVPPGYDVNKIVQKWDLVLYVDSLVIVYTKQS